MSEERQNWWEGYSLFGWRTNPETETITFYFTNRPQPFWATSPPVALEQCDELRPDAIVEG